MHCCQKILAMIFVLGVAISSRAQTSIDKPPVEEFDLNIVNERITEENFFRSTALDLTGGDMRLRVGAAVSAGKIDVTLRGVTGHVRFRASFGQLDRLFPSTRLREQ